jgi:hypothetical protein
VAQQEVGPVRLTLLWGTVVSEVGSPNNVPERFVSQLAVVTIMVLQASFPLMPAEMAAGNADRPGSREFGDAFREGRSVL